MYGRNLQSTLKKSKSLLCKSQKQLSLLGDQQIKFKKDKNKPKKLKYVIVKSNDKFKKKELNDESLICPFIENKNLSFFDISNYNNTFKNSQSTHGNLNIANNNKQKNNSLSTNSNTIHKLTEQNNKNNVDKKQNKNKYKYIKISSEKNIKKLNKLNYCSSYITQNVQNKNIFRKNKTLNDLVNFKDLNNKSFDNYNNLNINKIITKKEVLKDVSFIKSNILKSINFNKKQNLKNNLLKEKKNNNELMRNLEINNMEFNNLNNFKELVYKTSLKDEKINKDALEFIIKIKKLINELEINKINKVVKSDDIIDIGKIIDNKQKIFKNKMQEKDKIIQHKKQSILKIKKQLYDKDRQINELKHTLFVLNINKKISTKYKWNKFKNYNKVTNKSRNRKGYIHNKTYINTII